MPPKKKDGSVSTKGSKKKKKKGVKKPVTIPKEFHLPPLTSVKCSTLQATVLNKDPQSMERLVAHYDYGKNLGEIDANGSTLIHLAVKMKDMQMLDRLLRFQQIPLNANELPIIGGHTALHHACLLNLPTAVEMLLQAGASPNVPDKTTLGETPLIICCKMDHMSCAQLLIHFGAALELRDSFGNTPSFWAYKFHHDYLIRELNLPPVHHVTAEEYITLLQQRNPLFVLPSLHGKKKKKKGGGGGKKKKK